MMMMPFIRSYRNKLLPTIYPFGYTLNTAGDSGMLNGLAQVCNSGYEFVNTVGENYNGSWVLRCDIYVQT